MAPWQRQYLQSEETFFKLQALLTAGRSQEKLQPRTISPLSPPDDNGR
jgi:hypothetical protein